MTPGHLDDAMLIWFPGVFKSRKSPFTNTYKLDTKLFVFYMTSMEKRVVYSTQKLSIFWRFTTACIMRTMYSKPVPRDLISYYSNIQIKNMYF